MNGKRTCAHTLRMGNSDGDGGAAGKVSLSARKMWTRGNGEMNLLGYRSAVITSCPIAPRAAAAARATFLFGGTISVSLQSREKEDAAFIHIILFLLVLHICTSR